MPITGESILLEKGAIYILLLGVLLSVNIFFMLTIRRNISLPQRLLECSIGVMFPMIVSIFIQILGVKLIRKSILLAHTQPVKLVILIVSSVGFLVLSFVPAIISLLLEIFNYGVSEPNHTDTSETTYSHDSFRNLDEKSNPDKENEEQIFSRVKAGIVSAILQVFFSIVVALSLWSMGLAKMKEGIPMSIGGVISLLATRSPLTVVSILSSIILLIIIVKYLPVAPPVISN